MSEFGLKATVMGGSCEHPLVTQHRTFDRRHSHGGTNDLGSCLGLLRGGYRSRQYPGSL
jgi:hypothetical protein